jgi:hypothetical protein
LIEIQPAAEMGVDFGVGDGADVLEVARIGMRVQRVPMDRAEFATPGARAGFLKR